jgi:hypothetical protein
MNVSVGAGRNCNGFKFCLVLRPLLLKMIQEVVNILQEALQIAEADETVLIEIYESKVGCDFDQASNYVY